MKTPVNAIALLAMATTLPFNALAQNPSVEERLDALEAQSPSSGVPGAWADRISVSGIIEIEAFYENDADDQSNSDLVVATAELGLDIAINDSLSGLITLLHEEDDTDLEVDVASLTYQLNDSPVSFVVGQDYLPFGAYETSQVSDTLALELGETRETVLMANYDAGALNASVYVFNGDQDTRT